MNKALDVHKNLLRYSETIEDENLREFITRFKEITSSPMYSNSLCYALNLQSLSYEYVSKNSHSFTGIRPQKFLENGIEILPEIMLSADYQLLSETLFPQMQEAYFELGSDYCEDAIFEIYYRFEHPETGELTPIVEYSSYARFDEQSKPTISTGICYESVWSQDGVRGIVRCNKESGQETVFDQTYIHGMQDLTNTERKLTEMVRDGLSKKEIAAHLNISIHTVRTHFKNIYRKLNVNSAAELLGIINQIKA
jgi:DNA-binding CsgD family transcriptional regulator